MLENFTEIKKFRIIRANGLFVMTECELYKEIDVMNLPPDVLMSLKDVILEYADKFEESPSVGLKVTQKKPPYAEYRFIYCGWDYPETRYEHPGITEKTWGRFNVQKACGEIVQLVGINTKLLGDYTLGKIEKLYEKSCKYVDEYCRRIDGHIPTELESFFIETNQLLQAILNE